MNIRHEQTFKIIKNSSVAIKLELNKQTERRKNDCLHLDTPPHAFPSHYLFYYYFKDFKEIKIKFYILMMNHVFF